MLAISSTLDSIVALNEGIKAIADISKKVKTQKGGKLDNANK